MPNAERGAGGAARLPTSGIVGFAVRTLGCKVNQVESEQIAANLLAGGFHLVPDDEAEVVVVNTCTVTGEADAKAQEARARRAQESGCAHRGRHGLPGIRRCRVA